jgi:hypothetical protein
MAIKAQIATIINPFINKQGYVGQAELRYNQKGEKLADNTAFVSKTFRALLDKQGFYNGAAWCAFFVKVFLAYFYSFDTAWISKNLTGSARGNLSTIEELNAKGDMRYIAIRKNEPQVGDIVVWENMEKGKAGQGHTGIITAITNSTWSTIEGNTGASKDTREGQLVAAKTRSIDRIKIGQYSQVGSLLRLEGFYRRNFSPAELSKLYYDAESLTLKFKA